jgi:hypothetical protein
MGSDSMLVRANIRRQQQPEHSERNLPIIESGSMSVRKCVMIAGGTRGEKATKTLNSELVV